LTVEYHEASEPSKDLVKKIEELANKKIKDNVPILVTKMNRSEAEKKYEGRVNETFIYDKIAVPEKITEVNLLLIEDW
jgi:alanyl-tRNA synthetase